MTSNGKIYNEILFVKHYCRAIQISCNINFPHLTSFLERSIICLYLDADYEEPDEGMTSMMDKLHLSNPGKKCD